LQERSDLQKELLWSRERAISVDIHVGRELLPLRLDWWALGGSFYWWRKTE